MLYDVSTGYRFPRVRCAEIGEVNLHRLLVVEDDNAVRNNIVTCLELEGFNVDAVGSTREALAKLQDGSYPIVLSDIYLDERTGLDVLNAARTSRPDCAVILMSGRGSMETVMAATRGGAFDYLAKPFDLDDMVEKIRRAEASLAEPEEKETRIDDIPETEMIGSSALMVDIFKVLAKVAPTDATLLVEGETGTGKELIARMIHRYSRRSEKPFVAVDCGSIPPSLLESELFGAMKGSFTGADRDRQGVFESANGGTIFLDEIGDIDLNFQAKLLRNARSAPSAPPAAAPSMSASSPPPTRMSASSSSRASSARISGSVSTSCGSKSPPSANAVAMSRSSPRRFSIATTAATSPTPFSPKAASRRSTSIPGPATSASSST